MFRIAKILFILLPFSFYSQQRESNYNLIYPGFIPANSSFDVSLTTTNSYPDADEFELLIIPESRLSINKVEFKSVYESIRLRTETINSDEFFGNVYSTKIKLDDSLRSEGVVFQILLNMKTDQSSSIQIKFRGMFKQDGNIVALLSPPNFEEQNTENVLIAKPEFYKPHKISEKALLFENNSSFQVDVEGKFNHNLLFDFWVKFSDPSVQFLKIFEKDFKEPAFILSANKFQMFAVSSDRHSQVLIKPFFIGKKSWYHITITTSREERTISFYCNGSLVAQNQLPSLFEENDFKFVFSNKSDNKSFLVDLLRIMDLNNSVRLSFISRHSVYFSSDSSTLSALYKMDSSNEFQNVNENIGLEFSNIKFFRSDAPLFARSPELNLTLLGNSYVLEWTGGDYRQAQYYILEKSSGNKPYKEIHFVQADNTQEKTYTFIDVPDENSEIVYYRVKQINYDGSVVYSSQVKVGQGITEPFSIGQNYPNPFNPKTTIEIDLVEDSEIEITIYSLDGTEVTKLFKGFLSEGLHKFDFDGEGLPSGIYLFKVATPDFTQTKKMILTK